MEGITSRRRSQVSLETAWAIPPSAPSPTTSRFRSHHLRTPSVSNCTTASLACAFHNPFNTRVSMFHSILFHKSSSKHCRQKPLVFLPRGPGAPESPSVLHLLATDGTCSQSHPPLSAHRWPRYPAFFGPPPGALLETASSRLDFYSGSQPRLGRVEL